MKSTFLKNSVLWLIAILIPSNFIFAQTLFFERVYDETLSQASYVVGNTATKEAIVIDAKRDIDTYLDIAKSNNLNITHITETHIHADFLSGSRELAAATGADLYLSNEGGKDWQYGFDHIPLHDKDYIKLGHIVLEVMHTPGHTPESITFLLRNSEKAEPIKAITGDFIFVGDVGRPDLLEKAAGQVGTQEVGAKQLYTSINRFMQLPENTEIWPGHGAGSFCGKSLSNIPQSTLQQEKLTNKALQFENDEAGFVKYILDGQPEPPKYFAKMKYLNKVDRPLLIEVPIHPTLSRENVKHAIKNGLLVVDTRSKENVANGFIPGSIHIGNGNLFSTFMGSLLDYNQQLVIVAEEENKEEITRKLMRIGMDNIYGFITDINQPNVPLLKSETVNIDTFKTYLKTKDIQIIDIRTEKEYKTGHIKGVENIVLTTLENNLDKINKDKPVIIHCQSGYRATIGHSILRKNGFDNIIIYTGGINDWTAHKNKLINN